MKRNIKSNIKFGDTVLRVEDNPHDLPDDVIASLPEGTLEPLEDKSKKGGRPSEAPSFKAHAKGERYEYNEQGLITNGPTLEQYVAAGYKEDTYPPYGFAEVESGALYERREKAAKKTEKAEGKTGEGKTGEGKETKSSGKSHKVDRDLLKEPLTEEEKLALEETERLAGLPKGHRGQDPEGKDSGKK